MKIILKGNNEVIYIYKIPFGESAGKHDTKPDLSANNR
jgi:hypothetical protein